MFRLTEQERAREEHIEPMEESKITARQIDT